MAIRKPNEDSGIYFFVRENGKKKKKKKKKKKNYPKNLCIQW